MRRDDDAVLLDIAHAAGLVAKFVAGHGVDHDEVWSTATKDIPELLSWVTPLLPEAPI